MEKLEFYSSVDLNGNNLLNVGNWPESLLGVKLLHADLSANPPERPTYDATAAAGEEWTDIEDTSKWTVEYSALCYAYRAADDSVIIEAVPIANYLSSALYGNGLNVDPSTGEVSVKIDNSGDTWTDENDQTHPYLSVSANGVKLQGIEELESKITSALAEMGVETSWDKIMVGEAVKTNYNVGRIKGATEAAAVTIIDGESEGQRTLKDLFNSIFRAKANDNFSVTNPSISINITPLQDNMLVGDVLTVVNYNITVTTGSYPYGYIDSNDATQNGTGVEWVAYSDDKKFQITTTPVGKFVNSPNKTNNTSGTLTLVSNYVVKGYDNSDNNTFSVKVTGKYTQATNYAKNNIGERTTKRIAANDEAESAAFVFKKVGKYPYYYGFSRFCDIARAQDVINDFESLNAMQSGQSETTAYKRSKITRGATDNGSFSVTSASYANNTLSHLVYTDAENPDDYADTGVRFWVISKNELSVIKQMTNVINLFTHTTMSLSRNGNSLGTYHVYVSTKPYDTEGKTHVFDEIG